jgi:hypothetical protein
MNKLTEIPGKSPFKVPDNYFEEVNRKIISVTSGSNDKGIKNNIYSRLKPYFLIAASVTGFILISYMGIKFLVPDRKNTQLAEIITDGYPEMYLNDIDISTLEENIEPMALSIDESAFTRKDIIDYLLLDNIEINDIYAQL